MKQSFTARESTSRGQALVIIGLLLFCVPLIARSLERAEFDGRPAELRDAEAVSAAQQDLVVTWQGSRLDDPRIAELREELIGQVASDGLLRGGSPYVAEVASASDVMTSWTESGVSVEKATESLAGIWLGRGGMKVKATGNGERDLEWTARRIEVALSGKAGRKVRVVPRPVTTPIAGNSTPLIEIPEFDLEVFCTESDNPLAVPAGLQDELLNVRGYPTSDEPEGQRLVESAFQAIGTPVAIRILLTDAGKAEPTEAARAVREAAAAAGIAQEDLLMTGSTLTRTERAETLRAATWSGPNGLLPAGPLSPLVVAMIAAGVLGLLIGGYSVDLACSMVLGGFGAAALAAAMNALGVKWTDSLLLLPPVVFVLTVATTLLEPAAGGSLSSRVRKPMSPSTLQCGLCLVTLLVGSNMRQATDREFALAGAAACGLAWALSLICVPPVAGLFGGRSIRRATHGLDFAEWIVTHHRVTATVAATVGVALAAVLLQPSVQNWVSAPRADGSNTVQFALEQSLTGTGELRAEIHFDAERVQRLRFLERAGIVRSAVENLRSCPGVTGAMSLAEAAPDVPRPADDARTRERSMYILQSNKVAEQIRTRNDAMGGAWLKEQENETGLEAAGETWVIKASVSELSAAGPEVLVADMNRSIQDVLRFHAGVSHELTGDVVSAALRSTSQSRRPAVIGALAVLSLILASAAAGSFSRAVAIVGLVALPGLSVLVLPGFRPEQFGVAASLAVALPLSLGVMSCVRLVDDLRGWAAATATRHEAIAFALTGSTSRSRQALVTLTALLGGVSILAPQVAPAAVRAGVWASAWATTASLAVFPLLVSGRLGRTIIRDAERSPDASDDLEVAGPIRLEPVFDAPHFELETARRRVRNAG